MFKIKMIKNYFLVILFLIIGSVLINGCGKEIEDDLKIDTGKNVNIIIAEESEGVIDEEPKKFEDNLDEALKELEDVEKIN